MSQYSLEKFESERNLATGLEFSMNYISAVSYETAAKVCNGIGPSWFPEHLRKLINAFNPSLIVVADNHDLGYMFGDGSKDYFHRCNKAFKENGYKVAKYHYKVWDPRRYYVMFQAAKFARYCDMGGLPAYEAAIKERKGIMKKEESTNEETA